MSRLGLFILFAFLVSSCSNSIELIGDIDYCPSIYPDYKDVSVPPNIAPLNFCVTDTASDVLVISFGNEKLTVYGEDNCYNIDEDAWHDLLKHAVGQSLSLMLCKKTEDGYMSYKPFFIKVEDDKLDPVLTYRLIPPGYAIWNRMGIYQRNLESFDEWCIYDNKDAQGNCVNCHSFCQGNPDKMLFHLRKKLAGTYFVVDGKVKKFDADMQSQLSNPVYPYWHPSGRYVAFSTNKTFQMFHSADPNRIEVGDDASDIVIYDLQNNKVITTSTIASDASFETFPSFSADGKSLYYCSAKAVDEVERHYKDVKYSLCRVDFDADNLTIGDKVDTLYSAPKEGRSATFPRVSPDGRWLIYTLSDYGNFSIWHHDADLYMVDLKTGVTRDLSEVNSPDVESYHSWSSNSRWVVFSSRRDDGLYTRPYIFHVDADGNATKPFMLPQKNPKDYYTMLDVSYNIPEFTLGKHDRLPLGSR